MLMSNLHTTRRATPCLVDIGANLTHQSFAEDLPEVLKRAYAHGVNTIIITGTDLQSSARAIELANRAEGLYTTVGWHPHYAEQFNAQLGAELAALLSAPKVKALGETGLDFYRDYANKTEQKKVFEYLLELAIKTQLPLFVHERNAHRSVCEMLRAAHTNLSRAVIHCFTGDKEALRAYLDLDLYIGITGWICDERRGIHLRELLSYVPTDRLMIETDSPYLLPRDLPKDAIHIKHRNEPAYLSHIAMRVAEYKNCSLQTLVRQTHRASLEFFALNDQDGT